MNSRQARIARNRHEENHMSQDRVVKSANTSDTVGEDDYEGHNRSHAHGSHASMGGEMRGPGPVKGAGEVWAGSPGPAARRYGMNSDSQKFLGDQPVEKTASTGKTPKGMRVEYEGE